MAFYLTRIAPSSAAPAAQTRDRDGAPPGAAQVQPGDGAAPRDRVTLSAEAQDRASAAAGKPAGGAGEKAVGTADKVVGKAAEGKPAEPAPKADGGQAARSPDRIAGKLTSEQERQLTELRQRDTHVRQHEAAHQAAGGALTGGASYSYQTGPDGRSYAVGGEVSISMQPGRTADETIFNARRVRDAALAPTDPSAQDLSVAAAATSMEMAAQARKAREATRAYARSPGGKQPAEREPQGTTQRAAEPAVQKAA